MRLTLLAVALLLGAPSRADDTGELLSWANGFETRRGFAMREPVRGDYVSNFGTLVEQSCLGGLTPLQIESATEQFERDLGGALEGVRACDEMFPELRGFLKDAVSVLRRSVISCAGRASAGTLAYSSPIHGPDTPTTHGGSVGEVARAQRLYYISLVEPNLREFNSRNPLPGHRSGVYFHESLHYTGANNLDDHNARERISFTRGNACQANALDDRIVFLQAACSFPGGPGERAQIVDRIRLCGLRRGCMDTLMTVEPNAASQWADPHMYGPPLAGGDARIFCAHFQRQTASESVAARQRGEAHERAGDVHDLVGAARGRLLLSDLPTPAPRYLAALSAEERGRVAADHNFQLLAKLCRGGDDGTIDAAAQPPECPLSSVRADAVGGRLVEFNNREAVFLRDLRAQTARLALFFKRKLTLADLERIETEINLLFVANCPTRPDGDFVPRFCGDGPQPIREAIASVRRASEQ